MLLLCLVAVGYVEGWPSQDLPARPFERNVSIGSTSSVIAPDGEILSLRGSGDIFLERPEWGLLPGLGWALDEVVLDINLWRQVFPLPEADIKPIVTQDSTSGTATATVTYLDGSIFRATAGPERTDDGNLVFTHISYEPAARSLRDLLVPRGLAIVTLLASIGAPFVTLIAFRDAARSRSWMASRMMPTPATALLFERWLGRSDFFRYFGGLCGGVVYVAYKLSAWGSNTYFVEQFLLAVIIGVAIGGAAAEAHLARAHASRSTSADLQHRRVGDYAAPVDRLAAIACLAAAALLLLMNAVGVTELRTHNLIIATALSIGSVFMQRLVAARSRPALPGELRAADDLIRHLAITRGFTRPAVGAATLSMAIAFHDGSAWALWPAIVLTALALFWWASVSDRRIATFVHRYPDVPA